MADAQTIQNLNADATKNLCRENDKLGCLLEKLHLEDRDLDGLVYQLEDLHGAIDCLLRAQIALAAVNSDAMKEAEQEAVEAAAKAKPATVTDYGAVPGRDC
jgi:hypothetical protein